MLWKRLTERKEKHRPYAWVPGLRECPCGDLLEQRAAAGGAHGAVFLWCVRCCSPCPALSRLGATEVRRCPQFYCHLNSWFLSARKGWLVMKLLSVHRGCVTGLEASQPGALQIHSGALGARCQCPAYNHRTGV